MHGLHISDRARTEYMNLILGPLNKYPSDRLLIKTPIFRIYDISRNSEIFLLTFQIKQHTDFFLHISGLFGANRHYGQGILLFYSYSYSLP